MWVHPKRGDSYEVLCRPRYVPGVQDSPGQQEEEEEAQGSPSQRGNHSGLAALGKPEELLGSFLHVWGGGTKAGEGRSRQPGVGVCLGREAAVGPLLAQTKACYEIPVLLLFRPSPCTAQNLLSMGAAAA